MNLDVFKEYETPEQTQLVWSDGTFLACRERLQYTICLFDMGTFFAEAWLYSRTKKVILIRGFSNLTMLNPYLEEISLFQLGLNNAKPGEDYFL